MMDFNTQPGMNGCPDGEAFPVDAGTNGVGEIPVAPVGFQLETDAPVTENLPDRRVFPGTRAILTLVGVSALFSESNGDGHWIR